MRDPGPVVLDALDRLLIDRWQGGVPICERPYAAMAADLGCTEDELIERLRQLLERGVLTRFGPMFQIERLGGCFVLAAMAVPDEQWDALCALLQAMPEVAHNYARTHELNMWFVLATESADALSAAIAAIEAGSGLRVHAFPKEREYFVEMKLPVREAAHG